MLKLAVACFLCVATVCAFENGWRKVENDNETVVKAATYAADELNKLFMTEYHLRLYKVIKAKFQRALGRGYNMKILLAQTKCKKAEVGYKDIKKCKFMKRLKYRNCHVILAVGSKQNYQLRIATCSPVRISNPRRL